MADEILVDFKVDYTELDKAIDTLEKMGAADKKMAADFKAANDAIAKQGNLAKGSAEKINNLKKGFNDVKTAATQMGKSVEKAFNEGVNDALKEAGVSADQFEEAISSVDKDKTLRQRLKEITIQLQAMELAGENNTQTFIELRDEAGKIKDAMRAVSEEVNRVGDGELALRALGEAAQGIAGGFAVVQGAVGIFGDESEELQKTLLKVNSAMAILQGLQQVSAVLQKESNLMLALGTVQTNALSLATSAYTAVVGTSTGALKLFRIALAATGIGAAIFLIYELIQAFKDEAAATKIATDTIEAQEAAYQSYQAVLSAGLSVREQEARNALALESELIAIRGRNLLQEREYVQGKNKDLAALRDTVSSTSEAYSLYNAQIDANNDKIRAIDTNLIVTNLQYIRQLQTEQLTSIAAGIEAKLAGARKNSKAELDLNKQLVMAQREIELNAEGLTQNERLAIIAQSNKKLRDLEREFQIVLQNDRIAAIEASLEKEQTAREALTISVSQKEIDLQKKLIQERADLELLAEGLTAGQILAIKQKSLADQTRLQREFNQQTQKLALENIQARNNTELSQLEVSDAKKLALTIENIEAAAQAEILENLGQSDKIKAINAKRDADIRAARIASIQSTLDYELQLNEATTGEYYRNIERRAAQQDQIAAGIGKREQQRIADRLKVQIQTTDQRLEDIDRLTNRDAAAVQKRIDALKTENAEGLISAKDYNLQYEQLIDEQAQIYEAGEERKTAITIAEEEARKAARIKAVQDTVEVLSAVNQFFGSLNQLASEQENARIEEQKARLEALQEAGAITEKEAISRTKRIEAEERQALQRQAARQKQEAVFNAFLAIPQAYLKGLQLGGPILAAVFGGLAAFQAGLVAARPIPKFARGKKNRWSGIGEVGEAGYELIQRGDGQMQVAPGRSLTYLSPDDKVFTHQESRKMLEGLNTAKIAANGGSQPSRIDYERLGKEFAKAQPKIDIGIHKDFVRESVGDAITNYFNNRYKF